MIKWFKRNNKETEDTLIDEHIELNREIKHENNVISEEQPDVTPKKNFLSRFKQGLSKTRLQMGVGIGRILLGKKEIDPSILEDLETLLIQADVGFDVTKHIIDSLKEKLNRQELKDGNMVFEALKIELCRLLKPFEQPMNFKQHSPFVILMIGINGAGKTTTIGKLAQKFKTEGKKVMLAAGDTFRAAAVEQLQTWGQRHDVPVVAQQTRADSASVIFDAFQAAKARGFDVLIADTAGRLHTQQHLMDELKKVKRVLGKLDESAPHETLLVLDASIGQNALNQAMEFDKAIGIDGIVMTKLDGTAKGGILFALASQIKRPFRYIGVGEKAEDMRHFNAEQFVETIFDND